MSETQHKGSTAYEQAGVSTAAGQDFVKRIGQAVKSTHNQNVLGQQDGFAGLYDVSFLKEYKQPVLVSGTDGVGTKLRLATLFNEHSGVGIDLVAMCANDILVTGAKAHFFLDYIATGKLAPEQMSQVVESICEGCRQAGAALVGGETAEHPGIFGDDEYDLAGFMVGAGEKDEIITGQKIEPGHVIIGLPSSGVHSNGLSLIRKIYLKDGLYLPDSEEDRDFLHKEILKPTIIYEPYIRPLLDAGQAIHGLVHITGGGFYENIPRILPTGLIARFDRKKIQVPEIFSLIGERGGIDEDELFSVYNMGVGMALACPPEAAESILTRLQKTYDEKGARAGASGKPGIIGEIVQGQADLNGEAQVEIV